MRVSQIQNLTWAGNVLVLAGLVWVGLQFWQAKKQPPHGEWKWVSGKSESLEPSGKRWPGEIAAFEQIWKTPIGGKVPPPPTPPAAPVQKLDRVAEFKSKFKYNGGWIFPASPDLSSARVTYDGKDQTVTPGADVGGFQLQQYTLITPDPSKREQVAKLVFVSPDDGKSFEVRQPTSTKDTVTGPGSVPFTPGYGPAIGEGDEVTERGPLAKRVFVDPDTGHYIIPNDERTWIERWGEKNILSKLGTKPDVDAQGVSRGLRITSLPEAGTPLGPSHGIGMNDVVRSINGVAMSSKEDVMNYLRGDGKGLERYDVVVDTGGSERTVVYRVSRPRR